MKPTTLQNITQNEIRKMDRFYRRNLMNSFPGFKSAVLIGTKGENGVENLAVFNSLVHLGAIPPLMGFILRPLTVPRQTFENIQFQEEFTINHIHEGMIEEAHLTSAKFPASVSEFAESGLTPEYEPGFESPFVFESRIKAVLSYRGAIPIPYNGTVMVVGEVEMLKVPSQFIGPDGFLNLPQAGTVAISGLDAYLKCEQIDRFDYVRPGEAIKSLKNA